MPGKKHPFWTYWLPRDLPRRTRQQEDLCHRLEQLARWQPWIPLLPGLLVLIIPTRYWADRASQLVSGLLLLVFTIGLCWLAAISVWRELGRHHPDHPQSPVRRKVRHRKSRGPVWSCRATPRPVRPKWRAQLFIGKRNHLSLGSQAGRANQGHPVRWNVWSRRLIRDGSLRWQWRVGPRPLRWAPPRRVRIGRQDPFPATINAARLKQEGLATDRHRTRVGLALASALLGPAAVLALAVQIVCFKPIEIPESEAKPATTAVTSQKRALPAGHDPIDAPEASTRANVSSAQPVVPPAPVPTTPHETPRQAPGSAESAPHGSRIELEGPAKPHEVSAASDDADLGRHAWALALISMEVLLLGLAALAVHMSWPTGRVHRDWMTARLRSEIIRREEFLCRARLGPYLREVPEAAFKRRWGAIPDLPPASQYSVTLGTLLSEGWSQLSRLAAMVFRPRVYRKRRRAAAHAEATVRDQLLGMLEMSDAGGYWRHELENSLRPQHGSSQHIPGLLRTMKHYLHQRIKDQRKYYETTSARHKLMDEGWEAMAVTILGLAGMLGVVHLRLLGAEGHGDGEIVEIAALCLPPIGAALVALRATFESHHLTRSYGDMARMLRNLEKELEDLIDALDPSRSNRPTCKPTALDEHAFRRLVLRAETLMSQENYRWAVILLPSRPMPS